MKDRLQLNSHPINARARKILKAAKIPWSKETMTMPATALMLWAIEEKGIQQLPEWAELTNFQDRYADLEEAVLDLDQRDPATLLALIEQGEDEEEIVLTAAELRGKSPEEAAAMLLEELRWGMEHHPEKYQA